MITLNIKQDLERAQTGLTNFQKAQVPYAAALALNAVAEIAKQTIKTNMSIFFDRPTPYTLNSIMVIPATKTNLTAIVGSKDSASRTPASAYLKWEITGGNRAMKSTERSVGSIFVPAKASKLDQYGNLPSSIVALIRSAIASGSNSVVSGSKRYVVIHAGNPRGLTPGVYVTSAANLSTKISGRRGSKTATTRGTGPLKPVVFFEPKATYTPRYDLEGIVSRVVSSQFARQFESMLAYALSTAK